MLIQDSGRVVEKMMPWCCQRRTLVLTFLLDCSHLVSVDVQRLLEEHPQRAHWSPVQLPWFVPFYVFESELGRRSDNAVESVNDSVTATRGIVDSRTSWCALARLCCTAHWPYVEDRRK